MCYGDLASFTSTQRDNYGTWVQTVQEGSRTKRACHGQTLAVEALLLLFAKLYRVMTRPTLVFLNVKCLLSESNIPPCHSIYSQYTDLQDTR